MKEKKLEKDKAEATRRILLQQIRANDENVGLGMQTTQFTANSASFAAANGSIGRLKETRFEKIDEKIRERRASLQQAMATVQEEWLAEQREKRQQVADGTLDLAKLDPAEAALLAAKEPIKKTEEELKADSRVQFAEKELEQVHHFKAEEVEHLDSMFEEFMDDGCDFDDLDPERRQQTEEERDRVEEAIRRQDGDVVALEGLVERKEAKQRKTWRERLTTKATFLTKQKELKLSPYKKAHEEYGVVFMDEKDILKLDTEKANNKIAHDLAIHQRAMADRALWEQMAQLVKPSIFTVWAHKLAHTWEHAKINAQVLVRHKVCFL